MCPDLPDYTGKIDIVAQTITNLTILAPSAKAVSIGVIKGIWEAPYKVVAPGATETLLSVTGRGRFRRMTLWISTDTHTSKFGQCQPILTIDGTTVAGVDLRQMDEYHGSVATAYLVGKAAGHWFPPCLEQRIFNVMYVNMLSAPGVPGGDFDLERVSVAYVADVEYTSSLLIRYKNNNATWNHITKAIVEYGNYP